MGWFGSRQYSQISQIKFVKFSSLCHAYSKTCFNFKTVSVCGASVCGKLAEWLPLWLSLCKNVYDPNSLSEHKQKCARLEGPGEQTQVIGFSAS